MTQSNISTASQTLYQGHIAEVRLDPVTGHHSLHAAVDYNAGDVIVKFSALRVLDHATYLTIQTGINKHITLYPEFLQFVNHSCEPNVLFDTTSMEFVSIKPIQKGDECRFFYPSTEWKMAQPFVCNCGSAECLQLIDGAVHLPAATLAKYRLTDFISDQLTLKQ